MTKRVLRFQPGFESFWAEIFLNYLRFKGRKCENLNLYKEAIIDVFVKTNSNYKEDDTQWSLCAQ